MKTIYKYQLSCHPLNGHIAHINLPRINKFLSFQYQGLIPSVWYEVDLSNNESVTETLQIFDTGVEIPDSATYLATEQNSSVVWHLYRVDNETT